MADDRNGPRTLPRRQVLGLLGTGAGVAVAAMCLPGSRRAAASRLGALATADAALAGEVPACVVRPELTEGPYFVDEGLLRSDIRSDPGDGSVRPGTPLALELVVSRLDGGTCVPFPGVLVDVWHCDAAGMYSDVVTPFSDTRGKRFLRGSQVTGAGGAARFATIYPGWYEGRTVHVHFKLRTDPAADAGLEFTSQLFFADALSDAVYLAAPYAARATRTVRNADDAIYRAGGHQLLADVTSDGMGGYTARLALAVEAAAPAATTSTSAPPLPTTTTTAPLCATIAGCLVLLEQALPDPARATTRRERRTARRLRHRLLAVARPLRRAATASGARRARLYGRARRRLGRLLAMSRHADAEGILGIPHDPIENAASALLAAVP